MKAKKYKMTYAEKSDRWIRRVSFVLAFPATVLAVAWMFGRWVWYSLPFTPSEPDDEYLVWFPKSTM